jgi:DNA-binding NtrC family response regulator
MNLKTLKQRENEHLQTILEKTSWDLKKAAYLLQIPVTNVKSKIMEHGLKKSGSCDLLNTNPIHFNQRRNRHEGQVF